MFIFSSAFFWSESDRRSNHQSWAVWSEQNKKMANNLESKEKRQEKNFVDQKFNDKKNFL